MSASIRRVSHEPTVNAALARKSAVGRLRTKFTVADGLPVDDISPFAPRSTSTRSYSAVSRLPIWSPVANGRPMPSIWKFETSKPRTEK